MNKTKLCFQLNRKQGIIEVSVLECNDGAIHNKMMASIIDCIANFK